MTTARDPVLEAAKKLRKQCSWEADAIEAHLVMQAPRHPVNQQKTARLLRRVCAMIEELEGRGDGN